jgi:hypothetical protein
MADDATLFGVRTVARARQAKPYRTRIGKIIDPIMPTRWAFVLCDQGHFI